MTFYFCMALFVAGLMATLGWYRSGLAVGVTATISGFGYRLLTGEEFRSVAADIFFLTFVSLFCFYFVFLAFGRQQSAAKGHGNG